MNGCVGRIAPTNANICNCCSFSSFFFQTFFVVNFTVMIFLVTLPVSLLSEFQLSRYSISKGHSRRCIYKECSSIKAKQSFQNLPFWWQFYNLKTMGVDKTCLLLLGWRTSTFSPEKTIKLIIYLWIFHHKDYVS